MSSAKQHAILCEGYDDRSFWKGWLIRLGCIDPTSGGSRPAFDVGGREVKGKGRYLFRTPAGSDLILQPFGGRSNARRTVEDYLGTKEVQKPNRLILNLDSDSEDPADGSAEDQVQGIALALGAQGVGLGPFEIEGSFLYPVIWKCLDPEPAPGLPGKQTLERLVAAAICAAYPERGPSVAAWLRSEPIGQLLPKSHSYSYYAKWFADHGAGDFYEAIWRDPAVAAQLERRLAATGARETVEALVRD